MLPGEGELGNCGPAEEGEDKGRQQHLKEWMVSILAIPLLQHYVTILKPDLETLGEVWVGEYKMDAVFPRRVVLGG